MWVVFVTILPPTAPATVAGGKVLFIGGLENEPLDLSTNVESWASATQFPSIELLCDTAHDAECALVQCVVDNVPRRGRGRTHCIAASRSKLGLDRLEYSASGRFANVQQNVVAVVPGDAAHR